MVRSVWDGPCGTVRLGRSMWDGPCDGPGWSVGRPETFIESSFSEISPFRRDLRDFVRIIHSLVKLYQVLEKRKLVENRGFD